MTEPAILALEDGTVFKGVSVGAEGRTLGEVVFNTAMTGYQEILTDPSYFRQIVRDDPQSATSAQLDASIDEDLSPFLIIRDRRSRKLAAELSRENSAPLQDGAIAEIDTRS